MLKGDYQLSIDNSRIAVFSASELRKGINLSKYQNTPQFQQAEQVLHIFKDYWKNERILRTIKYVEYQHQVDPEASKDITRLKARMSGILESYKSDADGNYSFFREMFDVYINNKPLESELYAKAESLLEEIRKLNAPVAHIYRISRAD